MNGKNMIDKVKAIASEKAAEHERKKIARAEAEEIERIEYEKQIIYRAKTIATENDISFMEALEIIKMADSTFDEILNNIAYEISHLRFELSALAHDKKSL